MPKTISTALQTAVRAPVTTIATCVEIRRKDSTILRLTNHDQDIVFQDNVYRHDLPFKLSSIKSTSGLNVDTTDLTLFADDETIFLEDFKNGLFAYADTTIFRLNYANPADGIMTMRKGWLGAAEFGHDRVVTISIHGLLKILDFEVGRVYQPSCDADLGDSRCQVAIDFSQAYSQLNPYNLGKWVYRYDTTLMTPITVINPSFETDGSRTVLQDISGWTKTEGARFEVSNVSATGVFDALDGTYSLQGADDPDPINPNGFESGLWQDRDLIAEGMDAGEIDDGQTFLAYFVALLQAFYLLDPVRIKVDILDEDGEVIDSHDSRYVRLDTFDEWRDRALVFPLKPGSRTARLWIFMRKEDGVRTNGAADMVRLYWWNHTVGSPYEDVVHQLTRLVAYGEESVFYPTNTSFEIGLVANANNPTITGWTTGAGNWWQVVSSLGGLSAGKEDVLFLAGGDDGGVVQRTYSIEQIFHLVTAVKLDVSRITLGKYIGRFMGLVGFADAVSAATVILDFLDEANTIVGTITVINAETSASVGFADMVQDFTVPATARKIRLILQATSPVGDGAANIGYDALKFFFYDAERPKRGDPVSTDGVTTTVFNTTPTSFTIDGNLVWKAVAAFVKHDVVDEVLSSKMFTGTDITGVEGQYETAAILWLSGDNAGLKNLVRTWLPADKQLKLYFREPYPIQSGDRFQYVRTCQRRFLEDCQLVFGNQINFRGFPHVPGRLSPE